MLYHFLSLFILVFHNLNVNFFRFLKTNENLLQTTVENYNKRTHSR